MTSPVNDETVVAAVLIGADTEEEDHLREREGDHDEIDAAGAQRQGAEDKRRGRRNQYSQGPLYEAIVDAMKRQDTEGIAADAKIGGVTETDHAAIAHDQVEADGGDRPDNDAGEDAYVERLADRRRANRHDGDQN